MRYYHLVLVLFFSTQILAQSKIDETLSNHLLHSQNQFVRVRIEFTEKFDSRSFHTQKKQEKKGITDRVPELITELQGIARKEQRNIRDFFVQHPQGVSNIQTFWIINAIICEIRSELLPELEQFDEIASIHLENNHFTWHEKPLIQPATEKMENGVEPGVLACNVRPLWDMGYTGRGRQVFIYDTGVWPGHPSFADRYLGNFRSESATWHGQFADVPNGQRSSHGTHVLGTVAGLERATNDTIGIAFNAYWMANDHIGTTVESLPTLADMMSSFEWALNPDGDISTSHDVPDVINNSWRWYDGADQEQCEGVVVDLMNAIEAAGIANVFAAGNFGPSNTTVSAPQRINTSEVNTFSVGSVNANLSYPFPISDFSSRGPKQCPGTGSLIIHPEVVAPGQNVRSAYNQNEYAYLSGTSMATPHVSGVILLLKEAFPDVSGEEILWALYLTTIDLGIPGEDNTYGMGLIDAHAAFLHLAQNYTPTDPLAAFLDLNLKTVSTYENMDVLCQSTLQPYAVVENSGTTILSEFSVFYSLNGATEQFINWTGTLNPGETVQIDIPMLTSNQTGANELVIRAGLGNGTEEYDFINNTRFYRFNIRPTKDIPFLDGFEHGFGAGDWIVANPDGSRTWSTVDVPNKTWGTQSAWINGYQYGPNANQRDELISPLISFPSQSDSLFLEFDYSYLRRSSTSHVQDTLYILLAEGCSSAHFDTLSFLTGLDLAYDATIFWDNVPDANQWRTGKYPLTGVNGQNLSVVFQNINRSGNNTYIDNVSVYEKGHAPLLLTENVLEKLYIYPNPNKGEFTVEVSSEASDAHFTISIIDTQGKTIYSQDPVNKAVKINLDHIPKGLYLVHIKTSLNNYIEKIVIQ